MTSSTRLLDPAKTYVLGGTILRMLDQGTQPEVVQLDMSLEGSSATASAFATLSSSVTVSDPFLITRSHVTGRIGSGVTYQASAIDYRSIGGYAVTVGFHPKTSRGLANLLKLADQLVTEDEEEADRLAGRIASFLENGEEKSAEDILRFAQAPGQSLELVHALCDALGRLETLEGRANALNVLTSLLRHDSAYVRDSAGLGLALLDDRRAIPAIEQCIAQEPSEMLKRNLRQVLEQLQ